MWKVLGTWVDRYFGEEEAVLLALMLVIALIVMVTFGQILAPFVAAIIFAFLLQGGVNRLVRWRVPRLVAVVLVFLLFVGVFLTILIVVLPLIGRQAANLASEIPDMIRHWQSVLLLLPEEYPHLISESQLKELLGQASKEVASMAERLVSFSFSTFPSLVIMMVYLVLVPLLVFFMLKDKDELLDLLASMLPQERPVMWRIWHEMNLQMANYVRGKAIEILVVGLVSYVFFLFMGLQYAALLGLLVGLSVVIPYIGAMIVTFPIAAVGYFQWGFGSELLLRLSSRSWCLAACGASGGCFLPFPSPRWSRHFITPGRELICRTRCRSNFTHKMEFHEKTCCCICLSVLCCRSLQ